MTNLPLKIPDQSTLWNGPAGLSWVAAQSVLDGMFYPIREDLVDMASAEGISRVLDIGSGSGAVSIEIAKVMGHCLGVDVSAPLIDQARELADRARSPAKFIHADAQHYDFEAGAYDLLVSCFGVMFFADPVLAFSNLRRATRADGQLKFIVWRSAAENPFLTTAERAAADLVPHLSKRVDGAVGPFAFADPEPVTAVLSDAGWSEICFEPVDYPLRFPRSGLELYMTRLGALGLIFDQADDALKTALIDVLNKAFAPFIVGDEVQFTAACWIISASNTVEVQND